jgi:hypothetical protein
VLLTLTRKRLAGLAGKVGRDDRERESRLTCSVVDLVR